jgi:hypothetical protein
MIVTLRTEIDEVLIRVRSATRSSRWSHSNRIKRALIQKTPSGSDLPPRAGRRGGNRPRIHLVSLSGLTLPPPRDTHRLWGTAHDALTGAK